jgi:hypothetical protein
MTKTINHFLINDSWYLVDLPGYGFAKAAKTTQGAWLGFTKEYFLRREALVFVMLLVDASIPPQPLDLECADWLAASEVRGSRVGTAAAASGAAWRQGPWSLGAAGSRAAGLSPPCTRKQKPPAPLAH